MTIRSFRMLAPTDLSLWSQAATGAGTITLSDSNRRATIVNAASTRTYLYSNADVTLGDWILCRADIVSADAAFDADSYGDAGLLVYEDATANLAQLREVTATDNGKTVCILYQAQATRSERFRIGVGTASNAEAGTLILENVAVYNYGQTQPTHVDKYYPTDGLTLPYTVTTTWAAQGAISGQTVTDASPIDMAEIGDVMLATGDSYGMNQRYPYYVQQELGNIVHNRHVGGETLEEIRDRLADDLAGTFWPASLAELYPDPDTLLMEGGGNSALGNIDASVILSQMSDCIDIALAAGVQRIVIVNLPPFLNYASYTHSKAFKALSYNVLLGERYRGYPVYDLYSAMKADVAAPDTFVSGGQTWSMHALSSVANGDTFDYDIGDGLHPTTAASQKIAEDIIAALSSYHVAATASRRRLTGGPISRIIASKQIASRQIVSR